MSGAVPWEPKQIEPIRGLWLEAKTEDDEFRIAVDTGGLTASAFMRWDYVDWDGLVAYFNEIDRDWRGWEGEKRFSAFGDPFALSAAHDGLGHIGLWVEFADQWAVWERYRVRAHLGFEVGRANVIATVIGDWVRYSLPPGY